MEDSEFEAWYRQLKAGDGEDIIKWQSGAWAFRHNFQDTDEEDGDVPEQLRGRSYEVVRMASHEWERLQEAMRVRQAQSQLRVSDFYFPPRQFTDEFVESLAAGASESSRVGDGARVMELAGQLYSASRSSHATGDAQRARALELRNEVMSYVDGNVVMDDRYRVMRAGAMKDYASAVALLEQVADPDWEPVARALIVDKTRERDGRSVSNMRRIGDLEHDTTGSLKQERVQARALIREARKSGKRGQGIAACKQLYRLAVTMVLVWDTHMRGYKMSKKDVAAMNATIRKLMNTVDEVDLHRHGLPKHEQEGCALNEPSNLDLKWITEYLGQPTMEFRPVDHMKGGSWTLDMRAGDA